MKIDLRHRLSLIVTLIFCLFVLPINEHIAFSSPHGKKALALSIGLKLFFALCLYGSAFFATNFIQRLRAKDTYYKSWLYYSAAYLAVMLIIFALIYPGHWVHDEFSIVASVKAYSLEYTWQHMFTNIFYTLCLYIFPTGVSIVPIQLVIISLIIGYICTWSQKLFKRRWLASLLLIPFFFFPVVLNNFYPLRSTLYSYLALLLLCKLLFLYYRVDTHINRYQELLKLSVLITLVSFWRPEGLYYVVLLPIVIIWLGFAKPVRRTLHLYAVVIASILICLLGFAVTKATSSSKYEITAFINPLSTMIHEPLQGSNVPGRLAIIDKTIDLSILKQYPSYTETPAFWNGAVRSDYEMHYSSFKKQYTYLVLRNPGPFLDNRINTFMATNSFDSSLPANHGLLETRHHEHPLAAQFVQTNRFSNPINPELKQRVVGFLLCFNKQGTFTLFGHAFWNAIIPATLLGIIGLYRLIKRDWFWVGIIVLILLRVPLIFLTAPANYFFYYLPVYIAGYFMVVFHVVLYINNRLARKHRRATSGDKRIS